MNKYEEGGKAAHRTADQCFSDADNWWDAATDSSRLDVDRIVSALRAVALEQSASASVICSAMFKIADAQARDVTPEGGDD